MSKYTKGKWEVSQDFIESGDTVICEVYSDHNYMKNPQSDYEIPKLKEGQANARLIASAPELLEACKEAIKVIDNHIADNPLSKTKLPEIRAFLAKSIRKAEANQ